MGSSSQNLDDLSALHDIISAIPDAEVSELIADLETNLDKSKDLVDESFDHYLIQEPECSYTTTSTKLTVPNPSGSQGGSVVTQNDYSNELRNTTISPYSGQWIQPQTQECLYSESGSNLGGSSDVAQDFHSLPQAPEISGESQVFPGVTQDVLNRQDTTTIGFQEQPQSQEFFVLNDQTTSTTDGSEARNQQPVTDILKTELREAEDSKKVWYDKNVEVSVEPVTKPGVEFHVEIDDNGKDKNYLFSEKLNKIYAGVDKQLNFNIRFNYNPNLSRKVLVRIMWVNKDKPFQPLYRCQKNNHVSYKNEPRNHVVVLLNDDSAEYVGTPEGKNFRDRIAVIIIMGNSTRMNIPLKIMCPSSCSGTNTPPTVLVFTLEDFDGGELLGREVVPIQVTSNFRRDMEAAEKALESKKLKRKQDDAGPNDNSTVPKEESPNGLSIPYNMLMNLPNAEFAMNFAKINLPLFEAQLSNTDNSSDEDLQATVAKLRRMAGGNFEFPKDK